MSGHILIIDPSPDADQLVTALQAQGYETTVFPSGDEVPEILKDKQFSAVITEHTLEGSSGLKLTETLHRRHPFLPILMLSSTQDSTLMIKAIQAGAYDFLPKPFDQEELFELLEEAIESTQTMGRKVTTHAEDENADSLIGNSRAMTKVYRDLAKLASTPVTVLIHGETGTGKELIARALYQHGHRSHKPFYAINCAAIPPDLLESELFGHEKGAFTGAVSTRIGRFEMAHGATLFLDEIGDMDLALQAKLLRVLQERQIQRVGAQTDIPVDVRFIAATHQDLTKMVADGSFREDLYYRLNASSIELPPLREREGDIPLLTNHFLSRYGRELGIEEPAITSEALTLLENEPFPGNIRQLQNILRRALIKRRGYVIGIADIRELLEDSHTSSSPVSTSLQSLAAESIAAAQNEESTDAYREFIAKAEAALLKEAMRQASGNQAQIARWLGITRYTLREKLKAHGIKKN